jgi:hypothetical protein
MTTDEHWQQIEELLKVERKRRTKRHGDELRAQVAELLATAEGRESILGRFSRESGFAGKEWFLRELLRTAEQMQAKFAEIPTRERSDLLHEVLRQSKPKADQTHWDALWLLHREGPGEVGREVMNSLDKVAAKRDDLVRTLSALQAWQNFPRERAAELLKAAKQSAVSASDASRIEQALQWVLSRVSVVTAKRSEEQSAQAASPPAVPPAAAIQVQPAPETRLPVRPSGPTGIQPPQREQVGAGAAKRLDKTGEQRGVASTPTKEIPAPLEAADVASRVAQFTGLIESFFRRQMTPQTEEQMLHLMSWLTELFFRRQAERVRQLEQDANAGRAEVARMHHELAASQEQVGTLQGSLQRETDIAQELRHEKVRLEGYLADRERDLASARGEVQKVTHQLADARQEIEATRRRADDYIHQAERERDSAVRTFQAKLWDTMQYYLIEVLEDAPDESSLSADQQFFRQRLREIKDVLRDAGVQPF